MLRFADSPVVSQCTDRRDTALRRILVLIFFFFMHGHRIKVKVTNILHLMMLKMDLYHSRALKMRVSNSSIISYTIFMEHCQILFYENRKHMEDTPNVLKYWDT